MSSGKHSDEGGVRYFFNTYKLIRFVKLIIRIYFFTVADDSGGVLFYVITSPF